MKILPVKPFTPSFKGNISIDVGGSTREGSCKVTYTTNDFKNILHQCKGKVNEEGKSNFKDSQDFLNKLIGKIKIAQDEALVKSTKKATLSSSLFYIYKNNC